MKKVFAIRDLKLSVFNIPFFQDSEIMAVRYVQSHMMNGDSFLSQFAADYELFEIGEFDEIQGKINMLINPKFIISCASIQSNMIKSAMLQKRLEEAVLLDKKEEKK